MSTETLIFQDDFNTLNFDTWEHETTLSGGGNWEFEWYLNNRSNSYVKDGVLYLLPTLTADAITEEAMMYGEMDIWGSTPTDLCTSN